MAAEHTQAVEQVAGLPAEHRQAEVGEEVLEAQPAQLWYDTVACTKQTTKPLKQKITDFFS